MCWRIWQYERRKTKFKELISLSKILVYVQSNVIVLFEVKKKNRKSKNPEVEKTKNGGITILSKCAVCDRGKSKFIKEQEVSGLLTSLGIKTPLSKILLVSLVSFSKY